MLRGTIRVSWRGVSVACLSVSLLVGVVAAQIGAAAADPYADAPHTPLVLNKTASNMRSALSVDGHHVVFSAPDVSKILELTDSDPPGTAPHEVTAAHPDGGLATAEIYNAAIDATGATVAGEYNALPVPGLPPQSYRDSCDPDHTDISRCGWKVNQVVVWRGDRLVW